MEESWVMIMDWTDKELPTRRVQEKALSTSEVRHVGKIPVCCAVMAAVV